MTLNVISSTLEQSATAWDQSVCECGHLLQNCLR